jgi:ABC-type multidrug transport system fused ATPase/permease subunit
MAHQQPPLPERPPTSPETGVIRGLADWRFNQYLTTRLLPVFYLLLVLGSVALVAAIVGLCFWLDIRAGIIAAAAAPLVLLVMIVVIRTALEYLVSAHRIMRIIERMDALPDQVADLSVRVDGITVHVDQLINHVDDIHDTMMHARPILRSAATTGRLLDVLRPGRRKK